MANFIANPFHEKMIDAFASGKTFKVTLLGSTSTIDDEDEFMDDPTTLGELSDGSHTAGHGGTVRKTLSNLVTTLDNPNDQVEWDNTVDTTYSAIDAGTVEWVNVHSAGTSDDSDAINMFNYDESQVTNGGDLTIQYGAEGLYKLGRAAGS
jgi:hypothetical protein